jgi:uncharacterized membrane protein YvbJ
MADSKKQYDGDYKVQISDKGNINFTLNWKWVVGISISILGFVGWLLLDKYFIVPMADKDSKIELLQQADKDKDERLKRMESNQKILLDRTDIFIQWLQTQRNVSDIDYGNSVDRIPHNRPGEDSPSNN